MANYNILTLGRPTDLKTLQCIMCQQICLKTRTSCMKSAPKHLCFYLLIFPLLHGAEGRDGLSTILHLAAILRALLLTLNNFTSITTIQLPGLAVSGIIAQEEGPRGKAVGAIQQQQCKMYLGHFKLVSAYQICK